MSMSTIVSTVLPDDRTHCGEREYVKVPVLSRKRFVFRRSGHRSQVTAVVKEIPVPVYHLKIPGLDWGQGLEEMGKKE